jgi:hypothetical protein
MQGIATSLNWFYVSCRVGGLIKACIRNNNEAMKKKWNETTWTRLIPTASYEFNIRFVLGLQQCSSGEAGSAIHAGMLDIAVSPFKRTWEKVEEEIVIIEVEVGKKIVDQNIQLQIKLTKEKQQSILFEQMHGRSQEYLPLTDPNVIDPKEDKKKVHISSSANPAIQYMVRGKKQMKARLESVCKAIDDGINKKVGAPTTRTPTLELICWLVMPLYAPLQSNAWVGTAEKVHPNLPESMTRRKRTSLSKTFVMDDDSSTKSILCHLWQLMVNEGILGWVPTQSISSSCPTRGKPSPSVPATMQS